MQIKYGSFPQPDDLNDFSIIPLAWWNLIATFSFVEGKSDLKAFLNTI